MVQKKGRTPLVKIELYRNKWCDLVLTRLRHGRSQHVTLVTTSTTCGMDIFRDCK